MAVAAHLFLIHIQQCYYYYYLHQGGHVLLGVCLSVFFSFLYTLCKSTDQIFVKILLEMWTGKN